MNRNVHALKVAIRLQWLPIVMGAARQVIDGILLLLVGLTFSNQLQAQSAAERLVEVEEIKVTGTRLPSESVILLSEIKLHDKVNDLIVNAACHKITSTGLIKSVEYNYDAYPDRPGVVLNLILVDEKPLLAATIKPPNQESSLWSCLLAIDPLFTRELPPTEKALAFYAKNIEKCLRLSGNSNGYASNTVTADSTGKPTGIVFEIRQYKARK